MIAFIAPHRLSTNPVRDPIGVGDLRVGSVFWDPVRTLVPKTVPPVSEPPGKSEDFQVRAGFFFRINKILKVC